MSATVGNPTQPCPLRRQSWIEIKLVDEHGHPSAGERYVLELADGTFINGRLDDSGKARVDGIDPGSCNVIFPDLDKDEWKK